MLSRTFFREMDNVQRQVDEVFKGFGAGRLVDRIFLSDLESRRFPRVNLVDEGQAFVLSAQLPGVPVEDLGIIVQNNFLTLSGERKAGDEKEMQGAWHRRERKSGKFHRTIELPVDIDQGRVKAECRHGILRVTLPKAEAAKAKKIEVQAV